MAKIQLYPDRECAEFRNELVNRQDNIRFHESFIPALTEMVETMREASKEHPRDSTRAAGHKILEETLKRDLDIIQTLKADLKDLENYTHFDAQLNACFNDRKAPVTTGPVVKSQLQERILLLSEFRAWSSGKRVDKIRGNLLDGSFLVSRPLNDLGEWSDIGLIVYNPAPQTVKDPPRVQDKNVRKAMAIGDEWTNLIQLIYEEGPVKCWDIPLKFVSRKTN